MLYYFHSSAIFPINNFIKVRVILFEFIIYVIILIILNYFVNFARVVILSDLY